MSRLIDADALYERACRLEAQALDYVGKLIERDGDKFSVEWKIWSTVLTERTAFKHDVFDAPTVEPKQRWIPCNKMLPEQDTEVFVYLYGDSSYIAWISSDGVWQTDEFYVDKEDEPIAWMPLPEAYKAESE